MLAWRLRGLPRHGLSGRLLPAAHQPQVYPQAPRRCLKTHSKAFQKTMRLGERMEKRYDETRGGNAFQDNADDAARLQRAAERLQRRRWFRNARSRKQGPEREEFQKAVSRRLAKLLRSDAQVRVGRVLVNYGSSMVVEDLRSGARRQCRIKGAGLMEVVCGDLVVYHPVDPRMLSGAQDRLRRLAEQQEDTDSSLEDAAADPDQLAYEVDPDSRMVEAALAEADLELEEELERQEAELAEEEEELEVVGPNDFRSEELLSQQRGIVHGVLPRRNALLRSRTDYRGRQDGLIMASNVDQIFIFTAVLPLMDPEMVDRCLIAAKQANIPAVIVYNKVDTIAGDGRLDYAQESEFWWPEEDADQDEDLQDADADGADAVTAPGASGVGQPRRELQQQEEDAVAEAEEESEGFSSDLELRDGDTSYDGGFSPEELARLEELEALELLAEAEAADAAEDEVVDSELSERASEQEEDDGQSKKKETLQDVLQQEKQARAAYMEQLRLRRHRHRVKFNEIEGILQDYERIGYRVLRLSARTGQGVSELRRMLRQGVWSLPDAGPLYQGSPYQQIVHGIEAEAAEEHRAVLADVHESEANAEAELRALGLTEDPFARNQEPLEPVARPAAAEDPEDEDLELAEDEDAELEDAGEPGGEAGGRRLKKKRRRELLRTGDLHDPELEALWRFTSEQLAFRQRAQDGEEAEAKLSRPVTSVFVGQSGTGKSSALNALMPGLGLYVRQLQARNMRGRHATTTTHLYKLVEEAQAQTPSQQQDAPEQPSSVLAEIIDSPGFQNYAPVLDGGIVSPELLARAFPELRAHARRCPLGSRCSHMIEPQCAVREQVNGLSVEVFKGGLWGDTERLTPDNAAYMAEKYDWVKHITEGLHSFESDQFEQDISEQQEVEIERIRAESRFRIVTGGSISLRRYQSYCELYRSLVKAEAGQFDFAELVRHSGRNRAGKNRKRRAVRV